MFRTAGFLFVIVRNPMMGTPRNVIKYHLKQKNVFNSTMMASFLQVIVSKKEKTYREKYVFYCSVSQVHINLKKNMKKNIKMTFSDIHINIIY